MTAQANLRAEYARWTTHPARCAICWIPLRRLEGLRFNSQLEMAHIISRARAGDAGNVVGNVIFLCSNCHGAEHSSGYHFVRAWPDIETRHLIKAKLELGELEPYDMAKISGYTVQWIMDLASGTYPALIVSERLRWANGR